MKSHNHVGDKMLVLVIANCYYVDGATLPIISAKYQTCHQVVSSITPITNGDMVNFDLLLTVWKPFFSRQTEDGKSQAGTHLIIIDYLSCGSTTAQKSNPAIINYYRHFLIKGNDDR